MYCYETTFFVSSLEKCKHESIAFGFVLLQCATVEHTETDKDMKPVCKRELFYKVLYKVALLEAWAKS